MIDPKYGALLLSVAMLVVLLRIYGPRFRKDYNKEKWRRRDILVDVIMVVVVITYLYSMFRAYI